MLKWQRIDLTQHRPALTWSMELQCAPTAQRFLTSTQKQRAGPLKRAGWTFWMPSPPLVSVSLSGSKWQSVSAWHTSTTSTARTVTNIQPINCFSYGCSSQSRYYVIGFRPETFMRPHRNGAECLEPQHSGLLLMSGSRGPGLYRTQGMYPCPQITS